MLQIAYTKGQTKLSSETFKNASKSNFPPKLTTAFDM